jgi:hypothetical protein
MQSIAEIEEQFNSDKLTNIPPEIKDNVLATVTSFLNRMNAGKGRLVVECDLLELELTNSIPSPPMIVGERLVIIMYREV